MKLDFSKRPNCTTAAGIVIAMLFSTAPATALDLRDEGQALARQWCTSCHVVEPGQSASSRAPAFSEIAANERVTDDHLRAWLSTPHAQMPDMNLSRNEIKALISYFDSLRPE